MINNTNALAIQNILVGAAQRGRPWQYQKEIDCVLPNELSQIQIQYDLHDGDDEWGPKLDDCEAIILTSRGLGSQAIARAPKLRFVQKLGRATERVDLEACRERGIHVSVLPDAGHVAVAEHTLSLLMAAERHLIATDAAVRRGDNPLQLDRIVTTQTQRYPNWLGSDQNRFRPLSELTLGLIGFGEIAREFAWRAHALGINIIYTTRSGPKGYADEKLGTHVSMQELLRRADVISLHATQPDGVPPIIGPTELALMRSDATFINTARGNQVDQDALFDALRSGRLGAAALDVFHTEPIDPAVLQDVPNLTLTPHTASNTIMGSRFKGALLNILRLNQGKQIVSLLD